MTEMKPKISITRNNWESSIELLIDFFSDESILTKRSEMLVNGLFANYDSSDRLIGLSMTFEDDTLTDEARRALYHIPSYTGQPVSKSKI